jgi:glycosyltransferase involved in cell wall biosynthesis
MPSMEDGLKLREAKVAWVLPVLGMEGNLLYNKSLFESLSARCRDFRVFTAEFKGDTEVLGFEVERYGAIKRFYRNERRGVSFVTPAVVPALWRYHPDLIVVNEFSLWSLYALLSRHLIPRVRLLLMVEARPRIAQTWWLRLARRAIRTFMAKRADTILTNNADGKNYLIFELQAPARRVIVKPYLVSDMAFMSGISKKDLLEYRSLRETELPVRFLYVGRLLRLKGLQYALESLAALLPAYTGRFVFDVVGDGPFRESLEKQSKELGLSEQVRFHGRQPYSTLWEWYKRADVFLFPSLGDYRALVPFEALSMGLPIVASLHDGGVNETIDEERNGFSFDPRDTAMLSNILIRFIEAPALIAEFSRRSMEMASAYTLERATESLIFACQTALSSGTDLQGHSAEPVKG